MQRTELTDLARLAHEGRRMGWEPPLPGPLLHKCVEEREKTGGFALHEPAVPIWPNAQGLVFDEDVCIAYDFNMSMAELIYEKAKSLPGGLQSQALGFVEYLGRRARAEVEAAEWRRLFRETRTLSAAPSISEEEIAAEIAAYRSGQ